MKQLDGENLRRLMLYLHGVINQSAESTINIIKNGNANNTLCYPPGVSLNANEMNVISQIRNIEGFEDVLRKIIIDSTSYPLFDLFNIIDGTAGIEGTNYELLEIVECEFDEGTGRTQFLHDYFYDTYWDWKAKQS